ADGGPGRLLGGVDRRGGRRRRKGGLSIFRAVLERNVRNLAYIRECAAVDREMEHFSRLLVRVMAARDATVSAADITRPQDAIVNPVEVHGDIRGGVAVGKIGKRGRANAPESFDAVVLAVEGAAGWRSVPPSARRGVD